MFQMFHGTFKRSVLLREDGWNLLQKLLFSVCSLWFFLFCYYWNSYMELLCLNGWFLHAEKGFGIFFSLNSKRWASFISVKAELFLRSFDKGKEKNFPRFQAYRYSHLKLTEVLQSLNLFFQNIQKSNIWTITWDVRNICKSSFLFLEQ